MLPDPTLQLLTAAADGELTPRQERQLRRLLDESADARAVYDRLRSDSRRLRALPKVNPPADLKDRVVARLLESTPLSIPAGRPIVLRPTHTASRRPWVPVAVAASLLLAITGGTFLIAKKAGHRPGNHNGNGIAGNRPTADAAHAAAVNALPRDNGKLPSTPLPAEPKPETNSVAVADPPAPETVTPPVPSPRPAPVQPKKDPFAAPFTADNPAMQAVPVRVPFLLPVADLDREDVRQKFVTEVGRDPASRLDLFVKDAAKGVEHFQAAAKAAGLHVHADGPGLAMVKRKDVKAVLVYTDALTPAELRDLFARLSKDATFDSLHVFSVNTADHQELQKVLGTDPLPKKPAGEAPKGVSANTADQVARTVGTPAGRTGEKHAVLVPYYPPQFRVNPAMSRELKQFLDRRGDRRPGAVPVMIVIRQG
jgi:hypothetical protein